MVSDMVLNDVKTIHTNGISMVHAPIIKIICTAMDILLDFLSVIDGTRYTSYS